MVRKESPSPDGDTDKVRAGEQDIVAKVRQGTTMESKAH